MSSLQFGPLAGGMARVQDKPGDCRSTTGQGKRRAGHNQ